VDLYEYQARDMFESYGVPVLPGIIAETLLFTLAEVDIADGHDDQTVNKVEKTLKAHGSQFGAYMARELDALGLAHRPRMFAMGIPDAFVQHGARKALLAAIGLDAVGIAARVRELSRVREGTPVEPKTAAQMAEAAAEAAKHAEASHAKQGKAKHGKE
jgi:hypothetical protein